MVHKIVVPGTTQGKLKTQDMILSLLAAEQELTAKQLTNKIKKHFASTVTFQGVYKALGQLVEEGVLKKHDACFHIDPQWIRDAKGFMDQLQKQQLERKSGAHSSLVSEDVQVYFVDNLIDLDKFWIKICEGWYKDPALKDDKVVQLCGHAWYVLGHLENEEECLQVIKDNKFKFYTLVDDNTFLDKWSGSYYEKWGFLYKMTSHSTNKKHNHYYLVYDSMVIETVYPDQLAEDLNSIYKKVKRIEDLDLNYVIKILRRKENLKVTVMRNKPLADQLRSAVVRHWDTHPK